jgi:hypothetical protein
MKTMIKKYSFLFMVLLLGITVSSCATYTYTEKKSPDTELSSGPPPWAPAHGHRAKFTYRYYPSSFVYFNIEKGIYFYLSHGVWVDSYSLPSTISISPDGYVILKMDVDKPYTFHKDVAKRHPPGLKKKKMKGKGKYKKY